MLRLDGQEPVELAHPFEINGFEYEIREAQACAEAGSLQSERMTGQQTIAVMRIMDEIRSQWGMKYPCEVQEEEGKHLVELADQPQTAETAEATVTADVAEATEAAGAIEATVTAEALETAKITVTAGSAEAAEVTGTAENTEVSKTAEDIA